jgi:integrase
VASVYKPKIVTYQLPSGSHRTPDGQRVTKNTPGAVKKRMPTKKWYGRYTDAAGRTVREPLAESKEIAKRMLAKLAGDAQLKKVGIADPYEDHRVRPLAEHLADYRIHLAANGNTAAYVAMTYNRIQAIIFGCRFKFLDDIKAEAVAKFLAALQEPGARAAEPATAKDWYTKTELVALLGVNSTGVARILRRAGLTGAWKGRERRYSRETVEALKDSLRRGISIGTRNHYLTAVKGFTRWLTPERMPADPLKKLSRQNASVDVRRSRRALMEEQLSRFIEAAGTGKPFRGLTGADRLVLYTLAANTGFRASELGSLTPLSFNLEGERPTVTVTPAYSKRRKKDTQRLRPDVAEMIRQYITDKPKGKPLWPGTWTGVAADMVRIDLEAAGIPFRDDRGRCFDFHSLRGQFISLLAAKGVHPKVAQELARHSTITLTMDYYTHLDVFDVDAALDQLPELPGTRGVSPADVVFVPGRPVAERQRA